MGPLIKDALIGFALAAAVATLMLLASFNATFIYRGF